MPKKVRTPRGVITVPDDITQQELEELVNEQEASSQVQPAQRVGADEPDSYLGGALKGFREGVLESPVGKALNAVSDTFYSAPPIAATRAIGKAVIPQFVQETRLPTAKEGRGLASSLAAGVASGAAVAASPFSAGATLAALPVIAGGASAATSKLLGGDTDEVIANAGLDAAGAALPGVGRMLSHGGRSMVRGAFGFKRGMSEDAVEESIRSGIGVSSRGMQKARGIIDTLTDEVTKTAELLDQGRITASTGLGNMAKVRASAAKQGATAEQISALDNLIDTYRQRFSGTFSTAAAQQQKRDLYKPIEASFDQRVPSHLNQAKQAFASGFREEVEKEATREGLGEFVAPVNKRIGNLIDLEQQLAKQQHRGVGPIDAAIAALSPKIEAARMAFMPAPRAFIGRQMARTGDVIGAITDPFIESAAKAGGQSGLGGHAAKRAAAASEAKVANQRSLRDATRARRTQAANEAFESANPVEPGRGSFAPDDNVFPVERPAENIPGSWEDDALARFEAERAAQRNANAQAEAQLQLRNSQARAEQQRLRQENPEQLVLTDNPREPQQMLLGDEFDTYTPRPGQVPDRTGVITSQELPWRGDALGPRTPAEPFANIPPLGTPDRVGPGPSAAQLEAHRTRVPALAQSQAMTVRPRPQEGIQLPSTSVDLPVQAQAGDAAFSPNPRQLAPGAGRELEAAMMRDLGIEGDYGIISGYRSGKTPLENAEANMRLLDSLREEGYQVFPQRGVFMGGEEPSFLVRGIPEGRLRGLGDAFGQVSVIGPRGYIRLADRKTFPSRGFRTGQFDDNFSEIRLPDGRVVQYQMDFPDEAFADPFDVVGLSDGSNPEAAARYLQGEPIDRSTVDPILRNFPEEKLQRMRDQGYRIGPGEVGFHGSPITDIGSATPTFRPSKFGADGKGVYMTDTPAEAGMYGQQGVIYPLVTRGDVKQVTKEKLSPFLREHVEKGGFETWENAPVHTIVRDPAQIRSIFADFDPARVGRPELLAAIPLLMQARDPESRAKLSQIRQILGPEEFNAAVQQARY